MNDTTLVRIDLGFKLGDTSFISVTPREYRRHRSRGVARNRVKARMPDAEESLINSVAKKIENAFSSREKPMVCSTPRY